MNRIKTIALACVFACGVVSTPMSVRGVELIVTASNDHTAKLWDLGGNCLATLRGHSAHVNSAAFNPAGDCIVTASDDKTVKLWDLNGNCLTTIMGHSACVETAFFHPAGDRIITASWDKTAKLWDLCGNCFATFIGHSGRIDSAFFNPAGDRIVTVSSEDGTATLWDLYGNCLGTLSNKDCLLAVFNSGDNQILTTFRDGTASLWDLSGRCLAIFQGHTNYVCSAAFNPVGDRIVTTSYDRTAKLWDLDGRCLVTLQGHTNSVNSASFNPVGDRIVTASWDKTAKLWDLRGNCLVTFEGHTDMVNSAAFSSPEIIFLDENFFRTQQADTSEAPESYLSVDDLFLCMLQPEVDPVCLMAPNVSENPDQQPFAYEVDLVNLYKSPLPRRSLDLMRRALSSSSQKHSLDLMRGALFSAAIDGRYDVIQECIGCHEELLGTCNPEGLNVLHLAAIEGHEEVVSFLLEHDVQVDIPVLGRGRRAGWTALHCAVEAGNYEVMKVLFRHQASLGAVDKYGNTPLHLAAAQQKVGIVNALLTQGAPATKENARGQTPFDVAEERGNELVVGVLFGWQSRAICPEARVERCEEQEDTCCICLEPLENDHPLVAGLSADIANPCGHRIHEECSARVYCCPLCNKDLNQQSPWMRIY